MEQAENAESLLLVTFYKNFALNIGNYSKEF